MKNLLSSSLSSMKNIWNIFSNSRNPTRIDTGAGYYYREDRPRLTRGNERSIVTAIFNRIAMDSSAIDIRHVYIDEEGRYLGVKNSGLNNCLSLEANLDQTGRAFIQDVVLSMLDEGCVAIVPVMDDVDIYNTEVYDIYSLRTGRIVQWYPAHVRVDIYNEWTGRREERIVPKNRCAIIENPLYAVVNEPNSTMQRLIRKLGLLDMTDEQNSSGKLDLIIQLPYIIKSKTRKEQAEHRRKQIEEQLVNSKYGIAYTDGTERIVQLNRAIENNLMSQIEYLTNMLYSQLGMTQTILDGTADEQTLLNYHNRTIEPIISAIAWEMKRKFLTKTARSQGQSIMFFRDPFKLVPINTIADLADKMTRNEIMSSNEVRQIIGMKPSNDPKADELRNKNINQSSDEIAASQGLNQSEENATDEEYNSAMADLDAIDTQIDELENEMAHSDEELMHYASPYYDPVKAHEYYEEHKKLKGKRSTAGLNDKGKEAAQYVKERLNTERQQKVEQSEKSRDNKIETAKNTKNSAIESHKNIMNTRISQLRDRLKNMSTEDKAKYKDTVNNLIKSLREDNKRQRQILTEQYKTTSTSARDTHKKYKTDLKVEYDKKYEDELVKISAEKEFQKETKKKKS